MTLLTWNCQGSGGSLRSSKMTHLARQITSTKAQVCFISETKSSTISRSSLINRFNASDALVIPALGHSGGLWLIWKQDVLVTVVEHSNHFIFALCNNKLDNQTFGLVCIYGDPYHRLLDDIWMHIYSFVQSNQNLPMFCMGDMNEIMHPNEKHGPRRTDFRCINMFRDAIKRCGFIDLG